MTKKPILFNTEMVQAILAGRKTQTRRPIKKNIPDWITGFGISTFTPDKHFSGIGNYLDEGPALMTYKPQYWNNDILYVRETWVDGWDFEKDDFGALYKADLKGGEGDYYIDEDDERRNWKPSIHMPKRFARLFLKVTNVRVERVQDISEKDAMSEGVIFETCPNCGYSNFDCGLHMDHNLCGEPTPESAVKCFSAVWNGIYEKQGYGWDKNPWVWVYEFEIAEERRCS